MKKMQAASKLLRQWREISRSGETRSGFLVGSLLLLLVVLVKWPEAPPKIEPFIYAHF